ncbi:MAG TPA: hypothetical protein VGH34_03885 [Vicinamibacterales bacterium]
MALRIAFDLDGVLADMDSELARLAESLFGAQADSRPEDAPTGPRVETADPAATGAPDSRVATGLSLTVRQQRQLWQQVESIDNFWESLAELEPGVIQRMATLATERRWELIFLTRRPESAGATAQVQTQRWLRAHGFALPSVYVVQGSRGRIAAALDLDFVIDDRPENCLDVIVDSKARAILVWRSGEGQPAADAKHRGVGVVKTVAECLDILVQADSPGGRDQSGVVNRVLRLLGLKESARS